MKASRNTVWICAAMTVIFALGTILASHNSLHTVSSISANIFTGALVSGVITLVGYFNEKEKLLCDVETNLRQIYINLSTIKIKTGELISKISGTARLDGLPFDQLRGLCGLNQEFASGIKAELYYGFRGRHTSCFMQNLTNFKTSLSNLNQITRNLYGSILEHDNFLLQRATQLPPGQPFNGEDVACLSGQKELILIRASHLHEYQASLLLECEKLLEQFYKFSNPKKKWHEEKQALESSAAFVLNQSR